DISWTTGTNDWVCRGNVGSGKDRPECGWVAWVNQKLRVWIGKVRMIENVEKFAAQLEAHTFCEARGFDDGEVPIVQPRATERIAADVAEGAGSMRGENSRLGDVTTPVRKLIRRRRTDGARNARSGVRRKPSGDVPQSIDGERTGIDIGNAGQRGFEIGLTSRQIPSIAELARAA